MTTIERIVAAATAVLLVVPLTAMVHVSNGRMIPVERVAVVPQPSAPATMSAPEVAESVTYELPWWLQMIVDGPASTAAGGVELGAAVLAALAAIPAQMVELANASPEIAGAVAENPMVIAMFGAAIVQQIASDVRIVATTSKRAEAMPILGAMLADRISPGKFLSFVKKARKAKRVVNIARKVTQSRAGSYVAAALRPKKALSLCFVAGTLVHGADGFRPIETIALGDRVATTDLELDVGDVVDSTWKRISLELVRGPGDVVEIELLRSSEWVEQSGATEGGSVRLSIPEMGLDGDALVRAIRVAPALRRGEGHLVLATYKSTARDVVEVRFEHSDEVIAATSRHRLYSLDANDFVPAGALRAGERLRSRHGTVVVASVRKRPGAFTVYNLEVDTDHSYFVGHVGVLSHNQDSYRYGNVPGFPAELGPPGVPTVHPLVGGTVRALPPDDFHIFGSGISESRGATWMLRGPDRRTFTFRRTDSNLEPLARAQMRAFLAQQAGLPVLPTVAAVHDNRLGILEEIPVNARRVPEVTFTAFVQLTASYGDVAALDYIAGMRHRMADSVRLLEVEPKTYSVLPLSVRAFSRTITRADDVRYHPLGSSMSERFYRWLFKARDQRDALREHLEPYASHIDVDAMIDDAFVGVRNVIREVKNRPILVIPNASPYVSVHPVMMIPSADVPAQARAQAASKAFVGGPAAAIQFPELSPVVANVLRGIAPEHQLSGPAMAAYREQVQIQYYALWAQQSLSPASFASGTDYANAIALQMQNGFGLEMLALVRARRDIQNALHVDIGHPYDNGRYARLAGWIRPDDLQSAQSIQRVLGSISIGETTPGRDALTEAKIVALRVWLEARGGN